MLYNFTIPFLRTTFISCLFLAFVHSLSAQSDKLYKITIELDGPASDVQVRKAPLKYNKRLAYSFTLDDGLINHYTAAYPLMNGGRISENSTTYPGLFYTDGCGNDVNFKAGLAWYTVNSRGIDLHTNVPSHVTWDQLQELFDAGWDVFNHSYSHASNVDGIDFNAQVVNNTNAISDKIGFVTTHFVIPSGDSRYTEPAFQNNMRAVYSQGGEFPNGSGMRVDEPLNLNRFMLYRRSLDDNNHNKENINRHLDEVIAKLEDGGHYWYNEFTHHVGFNQTGGSLIFDTFEYYMQYLESNYGKSGTDIMWMAPLQEVYEYLVLRDHAVLNTTASGNRLEVTLDMNQLPWQRWNALSLVLDANTRIVRIEAPGAIKSTFNSEAGKGLVNLEWSGVITSQPRRLPAGSRGMNIYPNPTGGGVSKLNIPGILPGQEIKVQVFDITGREVLSTQKVAETSDFELDIVPSSSLKKGTYIIKAVTRDNAFCSRWMVE
jgi:hypothetical protein